MDEHITHLNAEIEEGLRPFEPELERLQPMPLVAKRVLTSRLPRFLLTDALHWESARVIQTWSYRWACEIFIALRT